MKTFRVCAEERVVRYKDFEATSKEEAQEKAEQENPATWNSTGDYGEGDEPGGNQRWVGTLSRVLEHVVEKIEEKGIVW